jgi:hypothetical protein
MTNLSMPRREALQKLAILLGGTLSFPAQAALRGEVINGLPIDIPADLQVLAANLAEVILPTTDTPGAKEAGVGGFITRVIRDCTTRSEQDKFLEGLRKTDTRSQAAFGKAFSELSGPQQVEIVGQLAQQEKEFFLAMRELTIVGYFTSELGATKTLEYLAVPGRFQGDIPLKPGQRVWAI